jgi:nitrogen fixation protein FixH
VNHSVVKETALPGAKNSAWRSPWVIGWVTIVAVVLMVNMLMVYLAIDANPGLVVEDYYERGQHYEKTMVARMEKDPGWKMQIDLSREPPLATPLPVGFSVVDKNGEPVVAEGVIFYAYRPSDADEDFSVVMVPQGPGRYLANVSFPLKGVWDTLVSVQKEGEEYHQALRVLVAPGQ